MVKRYIVVTGVPGSGKTHYRENNLAHFPFTDIADVYEDCPGISWDNAVLSVVASAKKKTADTVVIEGMFLPGTPSRQYLEKLLRGCGVEYIHVHAPYSVCKTRIEENGEGDMKVRLHILRVYWDRAEVCYQEERRDSKED